MPRWWRLIDPHPNPLPEGEGVEKTPLPEGEGVEKTPLPEAEGMTGARSLRWRSS